MSHLLSLSITQLRNFESVHINFDSCFNFIIGANASGKTSLLEAIYLLGTGRSFRAIKTRDYVQDRRPSAIIHAGIMPSFGNVSTTAAVKKIFLAKVRFCSMISCKITLLQ